MLMLLLLLLLLLLQYALVYCAETTSGATTLQLRLTKYSDVSAVLTRLTAEFCVELYGFNYDTPRVTWGYTALLVKLLDTHQKSTLIPVPFCDEHHRLVLETRAVEERNDVSHAHNNRVDSVFACE